MTQTPETDSTHTQDGQQSLLAHPDVNIRVLPSQLARMLGVSKQTVSQWIKAGKVTLGPDGRLNPAQACDQVMRNSDPGRLRAKVLRPLVDDVATLRRQIQERDHRIEELRARIDYLDGFAREIEDAEQYRTTRLVPERWDTLRALSAEQISGALDGLMDEALLAVGYGVENDDAIPLQEPDPEFEALDAETDALLFEAMRDITALEQQGGRGGAPLTHEEKQYDDENSSV